MSTSTKGLSLLIGVLVIFSLFSLVATVHVAAQPGTGTWNIMTIAAAESFDSSSLALDSNNYPHISYAGYPGYLYSYQDLFGWHNTTFDTVISSPNPSTSLALDSNNYPHISYNANRTDLKYA